MCVNMCGCVKCVGNRYVSQRRPPGYVDGGGGEEAEAR